MTMTVLALGTFLLLAVLALVMRRRRQPPSFCPLHESMVEIRDDECIDVETEHPVASPWSCQRECLVAREADIRR